MGHNTDSFLYKYTTVCMNTYMCMNMLIIPYNYDLH